MDEAATIVKNSIRRHMIPNQPFLEIESLSKQYGNHRILNDLSLSVRKGELLVVLGESGSGKSTLLRLVAGLESFSAGKIQMDGKDLRHIQPHNRSVGIVFQSGNGYEHLNVRENLQLAAKVGGKEANPSQTLNHWIELLELGPFLGKKMDQLSGGQQQRVALARTYLSDKPLLLMDEPLASLDQHHRRELRNLIARIQRERAQTIVYVTHDSDEAMQLADRIAILSDGKIAQVAPPQDVYLSPVSHSVACRLGSLPMDQLELPTKWFRLEGKSTETLRCGIRPHWWSVVAAGTQPTETGGFVMGLRESDCRQKILACGRITQARWLGENWHLQMSVEGKNLAIAVPICSLSVEFDNVIRNGLTRSNDRENDTIFLTATIPKAMICFF